MPSISDFLALAIYFALFGSLAAWLEWREQLWTTVTLSAALIATLVITLYNIYGQYLYLL